MGFTQGAIAGGSAAGFDAFIRKYNADGSVAWTRQFGTPGHDVAWAVTADGTGAAIVVGQTSGVLRGGNAGGWDAFVRKYSSTGAVVTTLQFGTASIDVATAVSADQDNNFHVTGRTGGALAGANAGNLDVFVRKYNSSNSLQWTTQFGTSAEDRAFAVAAPQTSRIYVAGSTAGTLVGANQGGFDAFLRRLNASGQPIWTDQ